MTTLKVQSPFNSVFAPFFLNETDYHAGYKANQPLSVNVLEQADSFLLEVVAPGYSKEEISLQIQNRQLSISANAKQANSAEGSKWVRKEFSTNGFSRKFVLPSTVDTAKISANYAHGILTISVAKKEEEKVKEPQAIEIA
jgi:HSP20 family protein